jgi:hypothetical protein
MMAMRSRPTIMKRQRERARQMKAKEKFAKRLERGQQPDERPVLEDGADPDIADIKPGPQPLADWQIDEEPEKASEEEETTDEPA